MARPAALAVAALAGFLLAGCFGPAGLSLPAAVDGVQTVSDAADSLDIHRSTASENAKAAIAITDALGSFVRDISADQRALSGHAAIMLALRTDAPVRGRTGRKADPLRFGADLARERRRRLLPKLRGIQHQRYPVSGRDLRLAERRRQRRQAGRRCARNRTLVGARERRRRAGGDRQSLHRAQHGGARPVR